MRDQKLVPCMCVLLKVLLPARATLTASPNGTRNEPVSMLVKGQRLVPCVQVLLNVLLPARATLAASPNGTRNGLLVKTKH